MRVYLRAAKRCQKCDRRGYYDVGVQRSEDATAIRWENFRGKRQCCKGTPTECHSPEASVIDNTHHLMTPCFVTQILFVCCNGLVDISLCLGGLKRIGRSERRLEPAGE